MKGGVDLDLNGSFAIDIIDFHLIGFNFLLFLQSLSDENEILFTPDVEDKLIHSR